MQDATPKPNPDLNLIEQELQNELRSMFELDTQTYLQTYEQVSQQLNPDSWTEDIQELYRAIHTIKGGAVTVGANAVLATTTALEEMLSDLRYLQVAPQLSDGALIAVLVEAGEVVSGSLLIGQDEVDGGESALHSALERLKILYQQVQSQFLNEIDEHQQLCQDFANQGFDLMILELEMALEQVPDGSSIPPGLVDTAAQVFTDLEAVGKNLEMGSSWSLLIHPLFELLIESDGDVWRSRCQTYLKLLKDCALEGGKLTEIAQVQLTADGFSSTTSDAAHVTNSATLSDDSLDFLSDVPLDSEPGGVDTGELNFLLEDTALPDFFGDAELDTQSNPSQSQDLPPIELNWLTEDSEIELSDALAEASEIQNASNSASTEGLEVLLSDLNQSLPIESPLPISHQENTVDLAKEGALLSQALKQMETIPVVPEIAVHDLDITPELDEFAVPEDFLESLEFQSEPSQSAEEIPEWLIESPEEPIAIPINPKATFIQKEQNTPNRQTAIPKIPVPLDRLDRSARALVEILLSARATQGRYQSLQSHISQIVQLSQESAAYITQLRQMQDDYALLQDLKQQNSSQSGVQLETYRGGYTAINRLLENSLRLSEIGAEAAATAQITKQEFSKLNLNIKTLQNNVEESRLISFKSVAFRLRAIIRDLINRMGKPVDFVIEGESQNLDAGTIQVIEPALLHLIRNAYDHGIESIATRAQNGKPETATITLSLKRQGTFYHLSLVDDGAGIDRSKITTIAESKGLPLTQTDTHSQLLQVISQPGFSSQTEVSAVSGRGVGMDVVNHQVQSVGGSLKLATELGQGTQFEIKIPVPHLLVPCLVVKAGARYLAIPTDSIQTMRLWDSSCRQLEHPAHDMIPWGRDFDGEDEPMMSVLNYWQERRQSPVIDAAKMETAICLRILSQGNDPASAAMWLVIDDLMEELDLLISPLPSPLIPPIGMMGMSTLPTGDMIPVLEPGAIAQVLLSSDTETGSSTLSNANDDTPQTPAETESSNLILVVDDAALLRRRLEVSLVTYGYEVQCCRDGLEAWNWLQENPTPGLMITDIEMPQMDGLTLVDRCRQSGRSFPILVSSSRLSEEWSKEAKRVGANDYLTKGFSTNDLIERVSSLMMASVN